MISLIRFCIRNNWFKIWYSFSNWISFAMIEIKSNKKLNLHKFRSIESNFRLIEPCNYVQYFLQLLNSNFTIKHTLSKPKPRLYVLIMVCQHITNWSSNTLVLKVLKPNKLSLWQSVTKHITKIKMLKVKTAHLI